MFVFVMLFLFVFLFLCFLVRQIEKDEAEIRMYEEMDRGDVDKW